MRARALPRPAALAPALLAGCLACGAAEPPAPEDPAAEAETGGLPEPAPAPESGPAPRAAPPPVPHSAPPEPPLAEAPPPPAAPPLDLEGLERRLRETRALGVMTKLALKNEIDDLVQAVGAYHERGRGELAALQERFDLLVMKVMTLLQKDAPDLAEEIARSRQGLWALLADPGEFAKLRA